MIQALPAPAPEQFVAWALGSVQETVDEWDVAGEKSQPGEPREDYLQRRAVTIVPASAAGRPLVELLVERFTYHDRAGWLERLAAGRVLLNGQPASAGTRLAAGDQLEYLPDQRDEPPVDEHYRIIHQDDALLVVDKPANLPIHPAGRFFNHTLWALLRRDLGLTEIHFVNRLDRETSGLVLLAQTAKACAACARQLQTGEVEKIYAAVVEGHFPERLEARGWLQPDADSAVRKKCRFVPLAAGSPSPPGLAANLAHTIIVRTAASSHLSQLRIELKTGKLHQIRATLASLGYPIVGDKLYGVDETIYLRFIADGMTDADQQVLRLPRQALHAEWLTLRHPLSGQRLTFHAPPPPAFAQLLADD